jgi:hypothetical protein
MAKSKTIKSVRKIVSQTDDTTTAFPSLNFPLHKYFEEDTEVNGIMHFKGDRDFSYPTEWDKESIHLITIGKTRYDSVHENMTEEMLTPTDDNDFKIETKLDGNFTKTVLLYNGSIANKYKQDPEYLNKLGLAAFDDKTHTEDLISTLTIPVHILEQGNKNAEEEEARMQAKMERLKSAEKEPEIDLEAVAKMFADEAARLAATSEGTAATTVIEEQE